jgi:hypothetical protein
MYTVQKHNNCINMPSSQTSRSHLFLRGILVGCPVILKMEVICSSETLGFLRYTRRYNPRKLYCLKRTCLVWMLCLAFDLNFVNASPETYVYRLLESSYDVPHFCATWTDTASLCMWARCYCRSDKTVSAAHSSFVVYEIIRKLKMESTIFIWMPYIYCVFKTENWKLSCLLFVHGRNIAQCENIPVERVSNIEYRIFTVLLHISRDTTVGSRND